ncbi:MAG TPA: response regulator [Longimicrobiaceae bacterium]|nr:response regulator [Longimicrobiaceae bacterium]
MSPGGGKHSGRGTSARARTILVADDSEGFLFIFRHVLRGAGYRVLLARDGAEAVRVALSRRPALVVLDLRMPVLGGVEAARQLRADARTERTPLLAITSTVGELAEEMRSVGFDGYFPKPFDPELLLETIERLLAPAAGERRDGAASPAP